MQGRMRWALGLGLALIAAAAIAGCGGNSSGSEGSGGGGVAMKTSTSGSASLKVPAADGDLAAASPEPSGDSSAAVLPAAGPMVIKTGSLSLRLRHDAFSSAVQSADQIAAAAGGYVVSSSVSGTSTRDGEIVIRVPAARFTAVLGQLTHLAGGSVTSRSIQGQDVTAQFIDLNARAGNLRAQERVLLRLMNRATSVADTIRVESELSQVQGAVEELEGRIRYLSDQSAMATITLSLAQAGVVVAPGKPTAIGQSFRDAASHALDVITTVIAGAGLVLPIALLAALALLAGRAIRRRVEARTARPDEPASA